MKLLYLLFSFTTGGTERLVADICNEMSARGNEVHLYIVNDLYDQSMLSSLSDQVRVCLQKRPVGGGGKLSTLLAISRYIRRHKIQAVHCNALNAPELLLLKPALFPRVKVLYTVHSIDSYKALSAGQVSYRNHLCHRLIAISESVRQEMIKYGADPQKLVTVYNAIDLTRFPHVSQKPFHPDAPVIGNVARIDMQIKGQDILIEAIAQLKDTCPGLQCFLAGSADAAHQQDLLKLKQLVDKYSLTQNIHFLGNTEDVPALLNTLDIFVLPSRSEGFGISLVEALSTGLPCVAGDLAGPAEVLCQGKYGLLFRTGSSQDLAAKLRQLLANYPAHRAAAIQQVPQIRAQYDIVSMCDKLEALV